MNSLQVFEFEASQVRSQIDDSGNPWFIAKDVCAVLDIADHRHALDKLDADERCGVQVHASKMSAVNESGLYRLIFRSNKPEAERFRKWVFAEVLPAIRKTGAYGAVAPFNPSVISDAGKVFTALMPVAHAFGFEGNQAKLSAAKATKHVTGIDLPELMGATHLLAESVNRHFTATELGKRLNLSAIAFNRLLESRGLQTKTGDKWTMTARAKEYGVLLDTGKKHSNGTPVQQLKWLETVLSELEQVSA